MSAGGRSFSHSAEKITRLFSACGKQKNETAGEGRQITAGAGQAGWER